MYIAANKVKGEKGHPRLSSALYMSGGTHRPATHIHAGVHRILEERK